MNKIFIKVCFLLCVSLFMSCGNGLIGRNDTVSGQFANLSISMNDASGASNSRKLDVTQIKTAKVVVSGTGIELGSEPSTVANVSNGKNSSTIVVENIPVGNNRIVSVYAYDADGNVLFGGAIRTVMDIKNGDNSCTITKTTTSLGNVFYFLWELGTSLASISSADKAAIENVIDTSYDFTKINSAQIAKDYMAGGTSGLKDKEEYVIQETAASNIVLHVKGYKYCWYWEEGKDGSLLTFEDDTEQGEDWYIGVLDYSSINLIFKPNENNWDGQTGNLSRTAGVWYYEDGGFLGSSSTDTTAPVVTWVRPSSGSVLSETAELFAFAKDEGGISKVSYYAGSTLLGSTDGTSAFIWDTTTIDNGTYQVQAVAYDNANNSVNSSIVSLTVKNTIILTAVISSTSSAMATVEKTFDGSSSKGDIASYTWDFGDGTTGTGAKPTHTYESAGSYTVTLTVTGTDGSNATQSQKITVTEKSDFVHRDFREETVYFMMTDRFADGDSTNNNIWGDEYMPDGTSIYDYSEDKCGVLSYYHGGDFKGIINNLDYIKDMGFTAIWITPSVKQPEGRYFYDGSSGGDAYEASAFHGYWGYDFDQIDPHLHSSGKDSDGWDDYKAFIDACHAKGIRVMQDIVINHGNHGSASSPTKWADYSVQTIMDGKQWAWQTLDPYYEPVAEGATPSKNGFYSYYGFGQCADLIDFGHLGEDGKDSRHHLINVYKKFIDAGVDAFRIDTMAYIPNEFAGEFADAMYNYAKEKGNDYFYMIGEAWCGRYDAVARHSKDTTDSLHMLDMHLSCLDYPGNMQKVFNGSDSIGAVYSNVISQGDVQFSCMTEDEYTKTAMFVDNHDCYRCEGLFSEARYKNALNYIYLFRGVPIVYYGTEAMYSWSGTHPSTNKDDVVSRWMLGDVGINYVKNNTPTMYKHLKVLNQVYHASECIQKGAQNNVSINTIPAAFTRTWNGKTAAVLLNHQDSEGSYSFSDLPSGTYTLYTSSGDGTLNTSTVTVSGSYSLSAPANGFAVLDPQ